MTILLSFNFSRTPHQISVTCDKFILCELINDIFFSIASNSQNQVTIICVNIHWADIYQTPAPSNNVSKTI